MKVSFNIHVLFHGWTAIMGLYNTGNVRDLQNAFFFYIPVCMSSLQVKSFLGEAKGFIIIIELTQPFPKTLIVSF